MNDSEFDSLVDKLQQEIFSEAKQALGEKGFERWQNPKFCGRLEHVDSSAKLTGECGDTIEMFISVFENRLDQVRYMTDGCSSSSIAGSFAAEIAMGKTFEEVLDLRGSDVVDYIGCFPQDDMHCTHLAVRTIQEAVNNYLINVVKKKSK